MKVSRVSKKHETNAHTNKKENKIFYQKKI